MSSTQAKIEFLKQKKDVSESSKLIDVPIKILKNSNVQKAYICESTIEVFGKKYSYPILIEISGCELIDGQFTNCKITRNGIELDKNHKPVRTQVFDGVVWDKKANALSSYDEANRVWKIMQR